MPHFVQKAGPSSGASGSAITQAVPASGIPVGDLVVIGINCGANSASAVSDSQGNSYSLIVKNSAQRDAELYAAYITKPLTSSDTWSVTSAAGSFQISVFLQFTYILSATADKTANTSNGVAGTALVTGTTAATTQPDDIAVCCFVPAGNITVTLGAYTSDFDASDAGSNVHICVGHKELTDVGAQSESATASANTTYGACIATFKGSPIITRTFKPIPFQPPSRF